MRLTSYFVLEEIGCNYHAVGRLPNSVEISRGCLLLNYHLVGRDHIRQLSRKGYRRRISTVLHLLKSRPEKDVIVVYQLPTMISWDVRHQTWTHRGNVSLDCSPCRKSGPHGDCTNKWRDESSTTLGLRVRVASSLTDIPERPFTCYLVGGQGSEASRC